MSEIQGVAWGEGFIIVSKGRFRRYRKEMGRSGRIKKTDVRNQITEFQSVACGDGFIIVCKGGCALQFD